MEVLALAMDVFEIAIAFSLVLFLSHVRLIALNPELWAK